MPARGLALPCLLADLADTSVVIVEEVKRSLLGKRYNSGMIGLSAPRFNEEEQGKPAEKAAEADLRDHRQGTE